MSAQICFMLIIAIFLSLFPWCGKAKTENILQTVDNQEKVLQLIATLKDKRLRETDPGHVIEAIEQLGQLKAILAIDELIVLLTFRREFAWEKCRGTDAIEEIQPITARGRYPAIDALAQIGEPVLPPLIKFIQIQESDSLATENAIITILEVFRKNESNAIKYLEKSAGEASSKESAERLLRATKKAKEIIGN